MSKKSKSTLFIHPKLKPPRAFLPTLGGIKRTRGFWFWMSEKGTFWFLDAAISYPRVYFIRLGLTNSFIFHHLIVLKCDYAFKFIYITITQPNYKKNTFKNGQKWPKMAKNGQKWPKWPKMAKNGQKWTQKALKFLNNTFVIVMTSHNCFMLVPTTNI